MKAEYAIVDLFAGPGGLGEGFSAFRTPSGHQPFKIRLSVEREPAAHQTLLLRSFLRQFSGTFPPEYYDFLANAGNEPDWKQLYPGEWSAAESEALLLELGNKGATRILNAALDKIRAEYGDRIIVIGGPPCQAYSLVGRVRNKGNEGYDAKKDDRYFLYREYANIVGHLKPVAFVMENVKGILSAKLGSKRVFPTVLRSLINAAGKESYALSPIGDADNNRKKHLKTDGREFVIRSEKFGVPQCRHRVIVAGIRRDITPETEATIRSAFSEQDDAPTVGQLISGLPRLRSGLSRSASDDAKNWSKVILKEAKRAAKASQKLPTELSAPICEVLARCTELTEQPSKLPRQSTLRSPLSNELKSELRDWIGDPLLEGISNHFSRGHMESDLGRYMFAAAFASVTGRSPKSSEFPNGLAPKHKNWKSGKFADRFRVQVSDGPATTVTSHISKDGHANIHPDPEQCRSLTVREAARLQTFPDNYHFKGNRTQQYVQVGNAVPPFLALKIAESLWLTLEEIGLSDERQSSVSRKQGLHGMAADPAAEVRIDA